ncbi:MAG: class I tRNA ligase family protein, partial [Thermofilaceae archaeon]
MDCVRPLSQEYKPKEFEPRILEFWRKERIYEKIRENSKDKPVFYFLDGPPYPSSDTPHVGTLWNKILKDAIIRFKRARGYSVVDRPGYDCHGLPIEVKVEQELGFTSKKDIESFGVDKFVQRCRDFALRNASSMTRHFEEFGVSMAWNDPYLTLSSSYVQSAWWLIKRAEEEGLLERGVKVVHWCPRCETTLADYEVTEYRDLTDPSIYVKFPVKNNPGRYLLVWTTTPWTLPANVAIMANPNLRYVWVDVNGDILLLSRSRLEEVMGEAGVGYYRVVSEVEGKDLKDLEYLHPLA